MIGSQHPPDCWVVTDGAAGNENQAVALAQALDRTPEVMRVTTRAPWRWFAPHLAVGATHAFGRAFAVRLQQPPPPLVIGCGRQSALATRLIRQRAGNGTRVVQILDPRIDPRAFDLVVAPRHDALRGENVLTTLGGLNTIDDAWLANARAQWPALSALPGPRTALLLGGSNRALQIDRDYWRALVAHVAARLDGGALLVTTSRRSPDWLRAAARADFAHLPSLQWHGDNDGPNPYAGMLAAADRIVVTPDSVNLLSEACATHAPVWVHRPQSLRGKIGDFVDALVASGRVQVFGAAPQTNANTAPLRETARVAAEIRRRLAID